MHSPAPGIDVSIVIPAHNAARTLARVLVPLHPLPPGWELCVVDDHSTDSTAAVATAAGVRVVLSDSARSDSGARNTGARATTGVHLVFLDSDVVVEIKTIRRALDLVRDGSFAAVFGVYDRGDHLEGAISRYKNAWIRFTTLHAPRPLRWINTSLAVMRRSSYARAGEFHEGFNRDGGGGDLDFGRALAENSGPIYAGDRVIVSHLKEFTLLSLVENDFRRAQGWFRLARRRRGWASVLRRPGHANVTPRFSLGVLAASMGTLSLLTSPFLPRLFPVFLLAVVAHLILGLPFLRAAARDGVRGGAAFPLLLWIDQAACAAGLTFEFVSSGIRRVLGFRRAPWLERAPHTSTPPRDP